MPESEKMTIPKRADESLQADNPGFSSLITELRKRQIIETLAAFIGGGWLIIKVVERLLVAHYHFPEKTIDMTVVTLIRALVCSLIWRWFLMIWTLRICVTISRLRN